MASTNALAAGDQANTSGAVDVAIMPPADFNFKRRLEIINMRQIRVKQAPLLMRGEYNATPFVFAKIEDGKPWWGMYGQFVFGEGERSIEGPAEESRFVLNPFLLVAANSWTCKIWDVNKISEEDLKRSDFPFCWTPRSLRFFPGDAKALAVYDVTDYDAALKRWQDKLATSAINRKFGLVAYNAKDFGFNFMHVSPTASANISSEHKFREPIEIEQYLHCGDSSNYPGGCNNMSPEVKAIDTLSYMRLPARVAICLWKQRPVSVAQRPDFTFFIELR